VRRACGYFFFDLTFTKPGTLHLEINPAWLTSSGSQQMAYIYYIRRQTLLLTDFGPADNTSLSIPISAPGTESFIVYLVGGFGTVGNGRLFTITFTPQQ
jgi:hypothetical protein